MYLPVTAVLGGRLFVAAEGYEEAVRDVVRLCADVAGLQEQQARRAPLRPPACGFARRRAFGPAAVLRHCSRRAWGAVSPARASQAVPIGIWNHDLAQALTLHTCHPSCV